MLVKLQCKIHHITEISHRKLAESTYRLLDGLFIIHFADTISYVAGVMTVFNLIDTLLSKTDMRCVSAETIGVTT